MHRVRGAEAHRPHVEAFEQVEHLRHVHPGRRRRRRAEDLEAAVDAADRIALDDPVRAEVRAGDEAAGARHGLDQRAAQLARVQGIRALAGDGAQRLGVLGLHDPRAGPQGSAAGQEQGGQAGVTAQIGGQIRHAVREVRRRREAPFGEPDRGGGHVRDGERAEVAQGAAPARQRPRHRDGKRTHLVGASRGLPVARQRVGYRLVHRAVGGTGRGAQPVQHHVATVGQTEVGHSPAEDPDHHRLDHGEGEQGGHRRIDGVAAGEQHLRARGGGERMVGHHHRPGSDGRLLLAGEGSETLRGRAFAHAGRASLVSHRSIGRSEAAAALRVARIPHPLASDRSIARFESPGRR